MMRRVASLLCRVWWWLTGVSVCYANCRHNHGAWCKRRPGHLGKHRTSSGFEWSKGESFPRLNGRVP